MYTSLYLFNKCVKSVNCLWIWKVAKRNQAFLNKCKTVARILIGSVIVFQVIMSVIFKYALCAILMTD